MYSVTAIASFTPMPLNVIGKSEINLDIEVITKTINILILYPKPKINIFIPIAVINHFAIEIKKFIIISFFPYFKYSCVVEYIKSTFFDFIINFINFFPISEIIIIPKIKIIIAEITNLIGSIIFLNKKIEPIILIVANVAAVIILSKRAIVKP